MPRKKLSEQEASGENEHPWDCKCDDCHGPTKALVAIEQTNKKLSEASGGMAKYEKNKDGITAQDRIDTERMLKGIAEMCQTILALIGATGEKVKLSPCRARLTNYGDDIEMKSIAARIGLEETVESLREAIGAARTYWNNRGHLERVGFRNEISEEHYKKNHRLATGKALKLWKLAEVETAKNRDAAKEAGPIITKGNDWTN